MKSPLRYPGGKTRAIKILEKYIPEGTKEICSPFFGGGSFELHLSSLGIKVYAYDNYRPLVYFWKCLKSKSQDLKNECYKYFPMTKEIFNNRKIMLNTSVELHVASSFYVINRSSFSGSTMSGGMSPGCARFNKRSLEYLTEIDLNIDVNQLSFEYSIPKHNCLIFADPPYYIPSELYGDNGNMHRGFNHEYLSEILINRGNFILTYNDCEYIRNLYKDCKIDAVEWKYGMNKSKKKSEIIITKP